MQNLRGLRSNVRPVVAGEGQGRFEGSPQSASNRSVQSLKELIRTITLVIEAAEQSLISEFKFGNDFYDNVTRFEIIMIKRALKQAGGNQRKAAQLLGIQATTLNSKIKRYGVKTAP